MQPLITMAVRQMEALRPIMRLADTPTIRVVKAKPPKRRACPCSDADCGLPDQGRTSPGAMSAYRRAMFWQE